jgi:hypothetical protein
MAGGDGVAAQEIYLMRHRFQVLWPDAVAVTTQMIQFGAFGDAPDPLLVGRAIREFGAGPTSYLAVALRSDVALPSPAASLVNLHLGENPLTERRRLPKLRRSGAAPTVIVLAAPATSPHNPFTVGCLARILLHVDSY